MSTNSIRLLDEKVTQLLKSEVTISSLTDALREIVQNSVDAGAKNIDIAVDFKQLSIVIKDDGTGFTPDELNKVGVRYYTSKIRSFKELKHVSTFGFRGEAIHSISSISTLKIISKSKYFNATFETCFSHSKRLYEARIIDEESEFKSITSSSGTLISLSNIFSNIPVRLNHLRKIPEAKMLEEIRLILFHIAVTHEDVNICCQRKSLVGNNSICNIKASAIESWEKIVIKSLFAVYGISLGSYHQFLETTFQDYNIKCVIGKIPVQSKGYQHIFYNGRIVTHLDIFKSINKLFLDSGFGEQDDLLTSSIQASGTSPKKGKSPTKPATSVGNPYCKYPLFVIKIGGPQSLSDIIQNAPKQIELSKHFNVILPLISRIMQSFLRTNFYQVRKVPKIEDLSRKLANQLEPIDIPGKILINGNIKAGKINPIELKGMASNNRNISPKHIDPNLIEAIVKKRKFDSTRITEPIDHHYDYNGPHFRTIETTIQRDVLLDCDVISQVDTKFILIRGQNETLYMIDQHACDERIRVESLLKDFITDAHNPYQDIAMPLNETQRFLIEVSNGLHDLFVMYEMQARRWGIRYTVNTETIICVTHLPEILHAKLDESRSFMKKCIIQYMFDLSTNVKLKSFPEEWDLCLQAVPTIILDLINSKACRSAIMFGQVLEHSEVINLVKNLSLCKIPFQCAHGRPCIVPICNLSTFNK